MRIELFEMERMQALHFKEVDHDLSESGVLPMSAGELLREGGIQEFLDLGLGYPLSEGSLLTRERVAAWHPGASSRNVSIVNGGSEANHTTLWTLLEPTRRLAFMVPNYMQGWGLGRHYGEGSDPIHLRFDGTRWALDLDELERAVTAETGVIMVCNPNNPTGHVLTEDEMDALVEAARRADAWLVADEIYRGAELQGDETSPTFWGRYEKTVVTGGLSKAFGLPGLRIGWIVAPEELIRELWVHHDYTTLAPGMLSDHLAAVALEPSRREEILARTRRILRRHLPRLEDWLASHDGFFRWTPPVAGAILYAEYDHPIGSTELVERIRKEQSVLLVPGDMFGLERGIRFGYGYDIDATLEGLGRVDAVLASLD